MLDDNHFTDFERQSSLDRGCSGNRRARHTTALVGTPAQVSESLLAYYDLGVTTFLIRGFDPLEDAIDYGRELIPIVRSEIACRDKRMAVGATTQSRF
jgi:alkanesulfonate monooxygenase SsuD/methylene tetrahydromethanopterin reductase-like flavin-dependent oxidoreductase (luciferase family)